MCNAVSRAQVPQQAGRGQRSTLWHCFSSLIGFWESKLGHQTCVVSVFPTKQSCRPSKDVFSNTLGSEVSLQPRALRKLGEGSGGVCVVSPAAQVALAQGCFVCCWMTSGSPSHFLQTHQSPACVEGLLVEPQQRQLGSLFRDNGAVTYH